MPFYGKPAMTIRAILGAFLLVTLAVVVGTSQPPAPSPSGRDAVRIRYQINALGRERRIQHKEMLVFFKALGFQRDTEPEEDEPDNSKYTLLTGTIPAGEARKLLDERHVKAVAVVATDANLPADPATPVRVQIEILRGLEPDRQRLLAEQVTSVLEQLGFKQAVAYDHRHHSRLVAMLPYGQVNALLEDLRTQPAGAKLPAPFALRWPVRLIEVLPQVPPTRERPPAPEVPKGQEKISEELRALLVSADPATRRQRLEVILATVPEHLDVSWQRTLTGAVPELEIEGRLGAVVAVRARLDQAKDLAALPDVVAVRLPLSGESRLVSFGDPRADANVWFANVNLDGKAEASRRFRLAVVDGDFRGWQQLVGKDLPAATRLMDLTAERDVNLVPDPFPEGDPDALGNGTLLARAAVQRVPSAEVTLIRIDPAAPYQLLMVAEAINGDPIRSLNLDRRARELAARHEQLAQRRDALQNERRAFAMQFSDDPDAQKRREALAQKAKALQQDERVYEEAGQRYAALQSALLDLKEVRALASALRWNQGYSVNGASALSHYLDNRPFRYPWLQANLDSKGQVWSGLFRDEDGNGVMEFAPPGEPLPAKRWTDELNFLGWAPWMGKHAPEWPAKATVRITIQWQEAHDPEFLCRGEDLYRQPLADLHLLLLRQRDPSGTALPADDMEVVAQSSGLPQRLESWPNFAIYEQTLFFTVPEAGRYALRVEGQVNQLIRPNLPNVPTLPLLTPTWELKPRIFVQTLAGTGRAFFLDYETEGAALGMPGR
jgi:hypothetical protein